MSTVQQRNSPGNEADPLIDEVRSIRRDMCDQFGNSVDRLCEHLREAETEYRSATGSFAGLSAESVERVTEGWEREAREAADPLIDEVRAMRKECDSPKANRRHEGGSS